MHIHFKVLAKLREAEKKTSMMRNDPEEAPAKV
jgi:hypothetical protein